MSSDRILSIDIGSSGVRACLFDTAGNMLQRSLVHQATKFRTPTDGASEFDAERLFKTIIQTIDGVLETAPKRKSGIGQVAWCSFWHGLICVDNDGRPVMPGLSWADTRSRIQTAELRASVDESAVRDRTGASFHSSFWPAKAAWLKKENPAAFSNTKRLLSPTDYVGARLFGDDATSVSMASATGLMNVRTCEWDAELMSRLGLKTDMLPVIAEDDKTLTLTKKWAKRWPQLADAKWSQAIGDGAANSIGSGCVTPARATLMIGTSGAMRVAYEGKPPKAIPDGLWCYRIDRRRVVLGGALSDGGNLYDHLKNQLHIDLPNKRIGKEMAKRGADAHGLTLMPFFMGERSTGYDENARGAIAGLTSSHDAIDILQAGIESVAFRFAEILDRLAAVAPINDIVLSGGAIDRIPVWRQIISDVIGRDVLLLRTTEASMRGVVLLALESIGKIDSISNVAADTERIEHHPKCHAIYTEARRRHLEYYDRIRHVKS